MSDSRYRGLDVTTQHCIEQVYLRDLLRHRKVVERLTTVKEFSVSEDENEEYPVTATLINQVTGETEYVRCKHLVGSDGASSTIRKQLGVKFEGISTDIYWGIMDCVFESTYPHFGVFGCAYILIVVAQLFTNSYVSLVVWSTPSGVAVS